MIRIYWWNLKIVTNCNSKIPMLEKKEEEKKEKESDFYTKKNE